jgi:hypothetical protein
MAVKTWIVTFLESLSQFWKDMPPPSLGQMEAAYPSVTLETIYEFTEYHNQNDHNLFTNTDKTFL